MPMWCSSVDVRTFRASRSSPFLFISDRSDCFAKQNRLPLKIREVILASGAKVALL